MRACNGACRRGQRRLAFLFELAAQQRECIGAALQLDLPAPRLGKLPRHGLPLFFQALRPRPAAACFREPATDRGADGCV